MKKQTIWLVLILVILVLIYIFGKGFSPKLEREKKSGFAKFDTLGITKININAPETEKDVTLEKIDDKWFIKEPMFYLADMRIMEKFLETMNDMKFEGIISENPEKQSKFQVDSTGTQVQIFKEDNLVLDFIVGKSDQNYSHTFLRESESDKVYSVAGNLSHIFNKKVDQWRDKVIVDIPKDEIDYIEVSYSDTTIYFTFVDTVWFVRQDDNEIEVEPSKLSSILNAFSPMGTTKFQDEPVDVNWDKPDETVVVTLINGTGYNLKFIKKDDREVYIKASNKDNIFISSSYMMKRFKKKLQDFQK
ncbi:MAG: DUF4340 domain-containing protein [Candidatus Cloacimonetes bacterium]|nr:DUF4340 domain-containing protein [Candidatus Cloacimonadota bacterium]